MRTFKNNEDRTRQDVGKFGENMAARFLSSRGYKILERNVVTPFGEIDLIGRKKEHIVFFEVKTRTSDRFGPPLSSITYTKKIHLVKSCTYYLKKHHLIGCHTRIDAIGINLTTDGELKILKHLTSIIEIEEWINMPTQKSKKRF